MRAACLLSLVFLSAECLPAQAQALRPPPFRLTAEAADAAAQRIDEAAMRLEWANYEQMKQRGYKVGETLQIPLIADDATFVRRVYLDLVARLPDPEELRSFLSDADPGKRAKLVDRLLLDPASGARRFTRLANMLRVKDEVLGVSLLPYVNWLRDASATSMPYDQLVRTLLTASGDVQSNPATGWLLGDAGQVSVTVTEAMRVFVDEDISCARCHDHPFNSNSQMGFYQLAACFGGAQISRVGPAGATVLWPPEIWSEELPIPLAPGERLVVTDVRTEAFPVLPGSYKYKDGKPGDRVTPQFPAWKQNELSDARSLARTKVERLREEFADWIVSRERFSLVAALRTWHELLGSPPQSAFSEARSAFSSGSSRVTKISQESCEADVHRGVPSNMAERFFDRRQGLASPNFGQVLSMEMRWARHDLREFERILCRTRIYHRECITQDYGMPFQALAPVLRTLPPETVWNNFMRVLTDGKPSAQAPLSHELPQVPAEQHPLRILGRGDREYSDDSQQRIGHRLVSFFMNGEPAHAASSSSGPLVHRLRMLPTLQAADEAFIITLGRLPTHKESMRAMDQVIANPESGWSDVVWALLNSREFIFQR